MESSTFWKKIFTYVQALLHEGLIGLAFQSNRGVQAR